MGHNEVWVKAAQQGVVLLPSRLRGILRVDGKDAQEFVNNYTTNDILKLRPDQGCTAVISNWRGTVTDHVRVIARPHDLLLIGSQARQLVVKAALEQYLIGVDVRITDVSDQVVGLEVGGPDTFKVLSVAGDLSLDCHRTVQFAPPLMPVDRMNPLAQPETCESRAPFERSEKQTDFEATGAADEDILTTTAIVIRTRGFHGAGAMVLLPAQAEDAMRDRLRRLGAVAIGDQAWEIIRMEQGIPEFGVDFGEDTNVWEARLDRSVSMQKGCYLGQEVVARLVNYHRVKRLLMGVRLDGFEPNMANIPVKRDEAIVGHVTSAAPSCSGDTRALAMVEAAVATSGLSVTVAGLKGVLEDRPFWSEHAV